MAVRVTQTGGLDVPSPVDRGVGGNNITFLYPALHGPSTIENSAPTAPADSVESQEAGAVAISGTDTTDTAEAPSVAHQGTTKPDRPPRPPKHTIMPALETSPETSTSNSPARRKRLLAALAAVGLPVMTAAGLGAAYVSGQSEQPVSATSYPPQGQDTVTAPEQPAGQFSNEQTSNPQNDPNALITDTLHVGEVGPGDSYFTIEHNGDQIKIPEITNSREWFDSPNTAASKLLSQLAAAVTTGDTSPLRNFEHNPATKQWVLNQHQARITDTINMAIGHAPDPVVQIYSPNNARFEVTRDSSGTSLRLKEGDIFYGTRIDYDGHTTLFDKGGYVFDSGDALPSTMARLSSLDFYIARSMDPDNMAMDKQYPQMNVIRIESVFDDNPAAR